MAEMMVPVDGGVVAATDTGTGSPLLLLHGWPQTRAAWRAVTEILAPHRRVIALVLPGLGESSPPPDYRKATIAKRVWAALRTVIPHGPVQVVGHDWGGIVAYLCAAAHPTDVSQLTIIDVVTPLEFVGLPLLIPGGNPAWHFLFHGMVDLPELLTEGREEEYLAWWFAHGAARQDAVKDAAARYAPVYRRPGRMRAGFDYYRAVFADIEDARAAAQEPLTVPVLAIGGQHGFGPAVEASLRKVATRVDGLVIPNCGHWVPEEAPDELSNALLRSE